MEIKRARILAAFSDKLNQFGPNSPQVKAFRAEYKNDAELLRLFDTVVKVQEQLRSGAFPEGDAERAELARVRPA